jgi:hypothetical protein
MVEEAAVTGPAARQRRGRRLAMTPAELDELLRTERTCRLGSVAPDGRPHVTPLWFVWDGAAVWFSSVVRSKRWANLVRSPQVSVVVDAGAGFLELRGAELIGAVEVVGPAPQVDADVPAVAEPSRLFGDKYGGGRFAPDGRHGWLRLAPETIVSWDHRKMQVPPAGG